MIFRNSKIIIFYIIFAKSIKMINKLWKIFNILIRGKYLNFSIFQLFGDNCFNEYLKTIIDLKVMYFDSIFVKILR